MSDYVTHKQSISSLCSQIGLFNLLRLINYLTKTYEVVVLDVKWNATDKIPRIHWLLSVLCYLSKRIY